MLVHLDQYSGETTYDGTPEEGNVAEQLWDDWSFPLHTGDFAGTISRSVWVVVASLPLVLGVTGLTMQLLRRRRRRARCPVLTPREWRLCQLMGVDHPVRLVREDGSEPLAGQHLRPLSVEL